MRKVVFLSLSGLLLTGALHAKSFVIDHRGSRPSRYRVTALCRGIDSHISPDVYKKSIFNKEGKDIKASSNGLALGIQGGRTVLLMRDWNGGDGAYQIIGDASMLDNMLPRKGLRLEGTREWDDVNFLWHLLLKSDGAPLESFTGEFFEYKHAIARLLAHVASNGKSESPGNLKVLVSFFVHYLSSLIDPNDHESGAAEYIAKAHADYLDPVAQAVQGATPSQRKALAQLNEEVLGGALDTLAYYEDPEQEWIPQSEKDIIRALVKEIEALQQSLEK